LSLVVIKAPPGPRPCDDIRPAGRNTRATVLTCVSDTPVHADVCGIKSDSFIDKPTVLVLDTDTDIRIPREVNIEAFRPR
jgi:hypothetical protein